MMVLMKYIFQTCTIAPKEPLQICCHCECVFSFNVPAAVPAVTLGQEDISHKVCKFHSELSLIISIFCDFRMSPLAFESIYHMLLLLFSILGIFYDGYFYCFHLFHIVVGNDILHRAIQVFVSGVFFGTLFLKCRTK